MEDAGTELQALEADMAVEPDDGYEPSIFGDDQPLADPGGVGGNSTTAPRATTATQQSEEAPRGGSQPWTAAEY